MTRSRVAGIAAAFGGICWIVAAWFAALSPPFGAQGNMENRFVTEDAWLLAALPLLAVGAWGLDKMQRGRVGTPGRVGAALFILGAVLASVSLALEATAVVVMERPLVEIGARVVLIPLGGLLLGWAALRARTLPVPVASLLLLGAALLYIANTENWMAALAGVFGAGWVLTGVSLGRAGGGGSLAGDGHPIG